MVFEPIFTNVAGSVRKNLGIVQSVVEIKLPINEGSVGSIYSTSAKSTILSSEAVGNDVNFVGLVNFQVVYDNGELQAGDYSAEFRDKFVGTEEVRGELLLNSNIIDVTSAVVNGGIQLTAIVEVAIDNIETKELNVLTGINYEQAYVSKKEIEYSTYIGKCAEKFDIEQDVEINGAKKILMVTTNVCLNSVVSNENFATVSGDLKVDICYQFGEANSDIRCETRDFEFVNDVALSGMTNMSAIQSLINVLGNEVKVSTVLSDDGAMLNIFVPVFYQGYVFNKTTLEVVDDMYTLDSYVSITSENISSDINNQSITFKDAISGTASIMETAPFIDEVIGVTTKNIVLASSRIASNKLTIEGIANTSVVYYTKETNSLTSIQVEMPFVIEQNVEQDMASVVTICLSDVTARSRRGQEIEVFANLQVYADLYQEDADCVITQVAILDKKQVDDCSLYIYIAKPNDTIWSIAKEMNVSQELLLEQNPDIELPLVAGERLVIYKPVLVDY